MNISKHGMHLIYSLKKKTSKIFYTPTHYPHRQRKRLTCMNSKLYITQTLNEFHRRQICHLTGLLGLQMAGNPTWAWDVGCKRSPRAEPGGLGRQQVRSAGVSSAEREQNKRCQKWRATMGVQFIQIKSKKTFFPGLQADELMARSIRGQNLVTLEFIIQTTNIEE